MEFLVYEKDQLLKCRITEVFGLTGIIGLARSCSSW